MNDNVKGTFHNDAMLRQITESVQINKDKGGQLINMKGESSGVISRSQGLLSRSHEMKLQTLLHMTI